MYKYKEYRIRYRMEHEQQEKECDKKWYRENKEYKKNYCKQWQKDNPKYKVYMKIYMRQYRKNNLDTIHQVDLRHFNKRKRNLGFEPLNEYFKGSEAHHISQELVIYIPIKIHKGISHCLETGKNMAQINDLAIGFI